jgi:hypothetical protein
MLSAVTQGATMKPTRAASISAVLFAAAACCGSAAAQDTRAPDIIVSHASVYTGPAARAQALAVRGARIAAVGSDAEILRLRGSGTRVIDAGGRLVIPGINDAHMHWGVRPDGTSLDLASMEPGWTDVVAALGRATVKAPGGSWIFGTVGARVLDDPRAVRSALDAAAPHHPVLLDAWTGHGALLNTAAMRKLGVPDDPPAAADGRVGRNKQGSFNGWLFEYPQWRATRALKRDVPREQAVRKLQAWARELVQLGITSVQVMPVVPGDDFATLLREAGVSLRVRVIDFPESASEPVRAVEHTDRVRPGGIKWILDGTPVERGAAIRGGYADRPESRGQLNFPDSFVRDALRAAVARDEQSLIHCAGDRCAEAVLAAMEAEPGIDWAARRVRLEHGDGLLADLMPRAARLGVVVVQNPTHFTLGGLLVERFGPQHRYMPLQSLLRAGVGLALGSDGPMNPFLNIQLASTHPARPEEALTREQALDAYTRGSAFAEHAEREKGTLAPGQLADLAILSQDIFEVPTDELPATTSVLTLVGGQVVHDKGLLERR